MVVPRGQGPIVLGTLQRVNKETVPAPWGLQSKYKTVDNKWIQQMDGVTQGISEVMLGHVIGSGPST